MVVVVVVVVVVEVVVVVVGFVPPASHEPPLSLQLVGAAYVPGYAPLKPMLADAPTPMLPFHVFLTVTV